ESDAAAGPAIQQAAEHHRMDGADQELGGGCRQPEQCGGRQGIEHGLPVHALNAIVAAERSEAPGSPPAPCVAHRLLRPKAELRARWICTQRSAGSTQASPAN